jgi:alkylated DNA nucleotide flippase Atl1
MILGMKDMMKEYKEPWHRIISASKRLIIGTVVSLLSATIVIII